MLVKCCMLMHMVKSWRRLGKLHRGTGQNILIRLLWFTGAEAQSRSERDGCQDSRGGDAAQVCRPGELLPAGDEGSWGSSCKGPQAACCGASACDGTGQDTSQLPDNPSLMTAGCHRPCQAFLQANFPHQTAPEPAIKRDNSPKQANLRGRKTGQGWYCKSVCTCSRLQFADC